MNGFPSLTVESATSLTVNVFTAVCASGLMNEIVADDSTALMPAKTIAYLRVA
jgi:hypothetical protein